MIRALIPLVCLLLSSFVESTTGECPQAIDPSPYDIVRDSVEWTSPGGRLFRFCLLGLHTESKARAVAVYEKGEDGWGRVFRDDDRGFHPWAIRLCELDGDSLPEVAVGVYKRSRFDPSLRKRIYIFDWTARKTLVPKWLGSRLAYPFSDFKFIGAEDGRSRLLTTKMAHGRRIEQFYRWNRFGFSVDSVDYEIGRFEPLGGSH